MWKEHWGKITSAVVPAVVLAIMWGGYNLLLEIAEAKATEWVQSLQTQIKKDIKDNRQEMRDLKQSVDALNRSIMILNRDGVKEK